MNPLFLLKVLTRWEILSVSGACMILIPMVSYLSSLRPRRRRIEFTPPAEKVLMETPNE
ncbi:MAG: hypothetical protein V3V57_13945 [Spirochaetia bacterium]